MNSVAAFKDVIQIGKIVAAHGIRGAVKVYSYAESLELYRPGTRLLLKLADGRKEILPVAWVKPHKGTLRLALETVSDRNRAEHLVGARIYADKAALPELDSETYYWFDLIGLPVYTTGGRFLGKVDHIIETGSNDVYVVKKGRGRKMQEILIPALKSVVRDIDLERQRMEVELPEGLE